MDEFEVGYDEESGATVYMSRRLTALDVTAIGLGLARDIASAFTHALTISHVVVANHANWQTERRLFEQQAGYDIEALTSGEEDEDG